MWAQRFNVSGPIDWGRALLLSGAACLLYVVVGGIRRVWFSPLSKFPGPKFAALTLWNEFYWDVVKRGTFIWKIQEMHEKYGKEEQNRQNRCTQTRGFGR